MSVRNRLGKLATCVVMGMALIATSCSAAPELISTSDTSDTASTSAAANTSEGDKAAAEEGNQATAELEAALDDLSEQETELLLQAFDEVFTTDGAATDADHTQSADYDPYAPTTSVPANGQAIDHTTIPYGLCDFGWMVFGTLTWSDAYTMLGHTGYNGVPATDEYEYSGFDLDAGASLIKDEMFCAVGDTDQTGDLSITMTPYRTAPNASYWTPEVVAEQFEGDIQFVTTQTGQPMVIRSEERDGRMEKVEIFLEWEWVGAADGAATLQLSYANFYDGVREEQAQALVAIAEMLSATVEFSPPAFTSPLPTWYACEGRNFLNADTNEIADLIGFEGKAVAMHGVERDWQSAECVLTHTRADGDVDWAVGEFAVGAEIYAPGSDEFGYDYDSLTQDPETTKASVNIGGREFETFSNSSASGVILDNGSGPVVIGVYSLNGQATAEATLAKAIEIVEVITR